MTTEEGIVTSVLTVTGFRLTDQGFTAICDQVGCSEEELIDAMVKLGWTIGLTEDGEGNIFWPPEPVQVQVTVNTVAPSIGLAVEVGGQTDVLTPD